MSAERSSEAFAEEPQAHENHERYLITYADMITLLMALFIILFAIAQVDLAKYERFSDGARAAVHGSTLVAGPAGGSLTPFSTTEFSITEFSNTEFSDTETATTDDPENGGSTDGRLPEDPTTATTMLPMAFDARWRAAAMAEEVAALVAALGRDGVDVRSEPRGLVVAITADGVLFESGSSVLRPEGAAVVDGLAAVLRASGPQIVVEGHTDDIPVTPPSSNWELSAMRATAVLRRLADGGVAPARLSAVGRADTVPIGDNATAQGRTRNRRVELVLVSTAEVPVPVPGTVSAARSATSEHITASVDLDLVAEAFASDSGGEDHDSGSSGH